MSKVYEIMDQAQVFAAAWSLIGGKFDNGKMLTEAEEAQSELRQMIEALAQPAGEAEPSRQIPKGWRLIGYYHKAVSGDLFEDDFFFADAINGDCPDCHPCYADEGLVVAPSSIYDDAQSVQQSQPLTAEQKQHIHDQTGAGHALICLVESYIKGGTK